MKRFAFALIVLALMSGCANTQTSSHNDFFGGSINVSYQASTINAVGVPSNQITFGFEKTGTYEISFSKIPGGVNKWSEYAPKDFAIAVPYPGYIYTITQDVLPMQTRITIKAPNGQVENHDFSY